jgi:hypothetical protein
MMVRPLASFRRMGWLQKETRIRPKIRLFYIPFSFWLKIFPLSEFCPWRWSGERIAINRCGNSPPREDLQTG